MEKRGRIYECVRVFGYSRSGQGLISRAPLWAAVDIPRGVIRGGDLPLLGRLCLQIYGGRPFLPSPLRGRVAFLLLLVVLCGGGVSLGVFGRRGRSSLATEATSGLLGLFLGLLLRRLVRC